jgi:hypothetical protein
VSLHQADDSEDRQPDVKGSSLYNEASTLRFSGHSLTGIDRGLGRLFSVKGDLHGVFRGKYATRTSLLGGGYVVTV